MEYNGVEYSSIEEFMTKGLNREDRESYKKYIGEAQETESNLDKIKRQNYETGKRLEESISRLEKSANELVNELGNLDSVIKGIKDTNNARSLRKKGKPKLRIVDINPSS